MKRVLVTGATGFVGAHAIPALQARGFSVHALGRRPPAGAALGHPALTCTPDAANGYLAVSRRTKSALITGIRRAAGAGAGGS